MQRNWNSKAQWLRTALCHRKFQWRDAHTERPFSIFARSYDYPACYTSALRIYLTLQSKSPLKPTRADLLAAQNKTVRDVIAPGLRVLFCGINPGLYSGATGHHFARPGNRFWPTLYQAGFTPRLLAPSEERELLEYGYGITNLVPRATATADDLSSDELVAGKRRLESKVKRYQPQVVAVLGISAYRTAFAQKAVTLGRQAERLNNSIVWVLPNPSGLNAHYQLANLVEHLQELGQALERGEIF
jgi:TDG/mug DNA glycosylase family protein